MTGLAKILLYILFSSVLLSSGCSNKPSSSNISSTVSTKKNTSIALSLPGIADVELTKGGSKSGRVTAINDKKIKLEFSGQDDLIAISDIKEIKFSLDSELPEAQETRLRNEPEIWRIKPLTDFQVKDSSKGEAEVSQKSIVKEKQPPPDPLGQPSTYQVKEMWFGSNSSHMKVKVVGID